MTDTSLTEAKRDSFFSQRLIRDYERLIEEFDRSSATAGETFAMFITPMDGRLIVAALRTAHQAAIAKLGKP